MDSNQSLAHAKRDCACHAVRVPKHRGKVLYGGCGDGGEGGPCPAGGGEGRPRDRRGERLPRSHDPEAAQVLAEGKETVKTHQGLSFAQQKFFTPCP